MEFLEFVASHEASIALHFNVNSQCLKYSKFLEHCKPAALFVEDFYQRYSSGQPWVNQACKEAGSSHSRALEIGVRLAEAQGASAMRSPSTIGCSKMGTAHSCISLSARLLRGRAIAHERGSNAN